MSMGMLRRRGRKIFFMMMVCYKKRSSGVGKLLLSGVQIIL
jgi:hypothetical protein